MSEINEQKSPIPPRSTKTQSVSLIDFNTSPDSSPKKPPHSSREPAGFKSESNLSMLATTFEVIVIYPFKAETLEEMSLELEQVIVVSATKGRGGDTLDDSWWYGEHTKSDARGWFPSSFVQKR